MCDLLLLLNYQTSLIGQQALGHRPTAGSGLGMTGNYTRTRLETLRQQIEQAFRRWPASPPVAADWFRADYRAE